MRGDSVRLTQVIANLLDNAGKYTDTGGQVCLRIERERDDVVVRVADDGMGIPAELLERVFDLFVQGSSTRRRAGGGLGIGLTLVKRIVALHGGTVHAASAGEGRGSEFLVRLPMPLAASPAEMAAAGSGPIVTDAGVAAPRRILVVDDNVEAAEALRYALVFKRHDVDVVHDGLEAVHAAERWRPDVVLLDIDLPSLNGLEVARRLRTRAGPGARGSHAAGGDHRPRRTRVPPADEGGRLRPPPGQADRLQVARLAAAPVDQAAAAKRWRYAAGVTPRRRVKARHIVLASPRPVRAVMSLSGSDVSSSSRRASSSRSRRTSSAGDSPRCSRHQRLSVRGLMPTPARDPLDRQRLVEVLEDERRDVAQLRRLLLLPPQRRR